MVHPTGSQEWILASWTQWGQYGSDCLHSGASWVLQVQKDAFWADKCPSNLPMPDGNLLRQFVAPVVHNLLRWHSHFAPAPEEHIKMLRAVLEKLRAAGLMLQPTKCEFFRKKINYIGHVMIYRGSLDRLSKDQGYYRMAYSNKCHWGQELLRLG